MSKRLLEQRVLDADQMHELGVSLSKHFRAGDLIVLVGPLGAGKTTLSRGIGEGLNAIGNVSSPTFVIARTHKRENSDAPLVHVDAYRLGSAAELDDLDIDFENSIVLVEWGKGLLDGISEDWLEIEIARDHTGETEVRELAVTAFGERWSAVSFS
jgi:tRNA threonylcarbamoyl adenosine modification protein YjeE